MDDRVEVTAQADTENEAIEGARRKLADELAGRKPRVVEEVEREPFFIDEQSEPIRWSVSLVAYL